ncbi:4Fe-4S ferredoxin iron-sulfur binding domain-containing protein, partial [gut metagenome]
MILYFSATGNSRYIAELLAERLEDAAFDLSESDSEFLLNEGESIGFVFPVHSWGMPKH